MFVTNLNRASIVRRDFSTFGYEFSLNDKSDLIQNESAIILNSLLEADINKITHGFFTFLEVQVDVDFAYNEFYPKIENATKLAFIVDYGNLNTVYTKNYIEEFFEKVKANNVYICLKNLKPGELQPTDSILRYVSFIMIPIYSNSKDYEEYIKMDIELIYTDISSLEDLQKAIKDDNVGLFTGDYIESPKKLFVKIATKPSIMVTELFVKLRTPSDLEEAVEIIKKSPELTLSILKFINSAFFALPSKVSSVESAVAMLGFDNLRKWVNLLFLSSLVPNPIENIYVEKSVARAYFMEKVCKFIDKTKTSTAYLTGLISMLDIMLDMPFEEIFKDIPVSQEIKDALIKNDNFFAELIDFSRAYEFKDKAKQQYYIKKYELDEFMVERAYLESLYEYDRFIRALR